MAGKGDGRTDRHTDVIPFNAALSAVPGLQCIQKSIGSFSIEVNTEKHRQFQY